MLKAVKIGLLYSKGLSFLEKQQYQEAMNCYEKCYHVIGANQKLQAKFHDLDIMTAECAFALGHYDLALKKIESGKIKICQSTKLNEIEKVYLNLFCDVTLHHYGMDNELDLEKIKNFPYYNINERLKNRFPIDPNDYISIH